MQLQYDPNWKSAEVVPSANNVLQLASRLFAVRIILRSHFHARGADGWSKYTYTYKDRPDSPEEVFQPRIRRLTGDEVMGLARVYAQLAGYLEPVIPGLPYSDNYTDVETVKRHIIDAHKVLAKNCIAPLTLIKQATCDVVDQQTGEVNFGKINSWLGPKPRSNGKTFLLLAALVVTAALGVYYRTNLADLFSQLRAKV